MDQELEKSHTDRLVIQRKFNELTHQITLLSQEMKDLECKLSSSNSELKSTQEQLTERTNKLK